MDEITIARISLAQPPQVVARGSASGAAAEAADLSSLLLSIRTGALSAEELERCIAELVVHRSALLARHGAMNRVLLRGFVDALLREEVKKLMAALENCVHLSALKSILDAGGSGAKEGARFGDAREAGSVDSEQTPLVSLPSSTPGSGAGATSDAESKMDSAHLTPTGWFDDAAAMRHVSGASETTYASAPAHDLLATQRLERGARKRPHPAAAAQGGRRDRGDSTSDAESGRDSQRRGGLGVQAAATDVGHQRLPGDAGAAGRARDARGVLVTARARSATEDAPTSCGGTAEAGGSVAQADLLAHAAPLGTLSAVASPLGVAGDVAGHPAKRQRRLDSSAPGPLQLPTRPPRVHFPEPPVSAPDAFVVGSGGTGHAQAVHPSMSSVSSSSSAAASWAGRADAGGAGAGVAAATVASAGAGAGAPSVEALEVEARFLLQRLLSKELFRDLERQWSGLLSRRWGSAQAVQETRLAVWDALTTTLARFRAYPGVTGPPEPLQAPPELVGARVARGGGTSDDEAGSGAFLGAPAMARASAAAGEDLQSLERFGDMLRDCGRCFKMEEVAAMHTATALDNYAIVSSIDFDVTGQYFATGEIANRVRVFDYATVVSSTVEAHAPILSFEESQKISCIDWNPLTRNLLTAVGHAGVAVVHDISAARVVGNFVAHGRRAWSVDSSPFTASVFATGGDDCTTKLWSTTSSSPAMVLEGRASVCCVQFNPFKEHQLAIGCADRRAYVYDVRNTRHALSSARGHSHAVAFVRFGGPTTLITSSTDSTVRYWDASSSHATCLTTHSGHVNSKNFLGLTHSGTFTATGSEDGRVVVYHQAVRKPLVAHSFGVISPLSGETEGVGDEHGPSHSSSMGTRSEGSGLSHGDEASLSSFSSVNSSSSSTKHFVSALCWRPRAARETLVAANSQGSIKVFTLRPPAHQ